MACGAKSGPAAKPHDRTIIQKKNTTVLRASYITAIILAAFGTAVALEIWLARIMGDHLIGIVFALILTVIAAGFVAPIIVAKKR
jgi:hypothetical protein